MANRYGRQFTKSGDTERWILDGYASVTDSVGTPSAITGFGLSSLTRTGVGSYSVLLQDSWPQFLSGYITLNMPAGLASIDPVLVTTDVTVAKTITFKILNTSGSAVDVPAQTGFWFNFEVKNSGVPRGQ
jgi:hypothetical protein